MLRNLLLMFGVWRLQDFGPDPSLQGFVELDDRVRVQVFANRFPHRNRFLRVKIVQERTPLTPLTLFTFINLTFSLLLIIEYTHKL